MATVSGGEALSAGFGIIRRAPLAFGLWILFDLVVGFLPSFLLRVGGGGDPAQMAASSGLLLLVTLPLALLTVSVMMSAAFRAALTPDDNRFFYLRLGRQELWVAAAVIVLVVIWILGLIAAMIPMVVVVGVTSVAAGSGGSVVGPILIGLLAYMAYFAAAIWGFLRLSLMFPIAFMESRVAIAEAWRLSKGNVWQMLGVWLVIFVIALFAYVVLFGTIFGGLLGSVPLAEIPTMLQQDPTALQKYMNPGVMLVMGLGFVALNTALRTAFGGAWAYMYRQLRGAPALEVFG